MRREFHNPRLVIEGSGRHSNEAWERKYLEALQRELLERNYISNKPSLGITAYLDWAEVEYHCESCDHLIEEHEEVTCARCGKKLCEWCAEGPVDDPEVWCCSDAEYCSVCHKIICGDILCEYDGKPYCPEHDPTAFSPELRKGVTKDE